MKPRKRELCALYKELWAIKTNVQPHPRINSAWKKKVKEKTKTQLTATGELKRQKFFNSNSANRFNTS